MVVYLKILKKEKRIIFIPNINYQIWSKEESENLNRPITLEEICKVIWNLSLKKAWGPGCFVPLTFKEQIL